MINLVLTLVFFAALASAEPLTCDTVRNLYTSVSPNGESCCDGRVSFGDFTCEDSTAVTPDRANAFKVHEALPEEQPVHPDDWLTFPYFDNFLVNNESYYDPDDWTVDAMPTYLSAAEVTEEELKAMSEIVAAKANADPCVKLVESDSYYFNPVTQVYKGKPRATMQDITWIDKLSDFTSTKREHFVHVEPIFTVPGIEPTSGNFTGAGYFYDLHANVFSDPLEEDTRARILYAVKYGCKIDPVTEDVVVTEVKLYNEPSGAYSKTASNGPMPYQEGVVSTKMTIPGRREFTVPTYDGKPVQDYYVGAVTRCTYHKKADGTYEEDLSLDVSDGLTDSSFFGGAGLNSLNKVLGLDNAFLEFKVRKSIKKDLEVLDLPVEDALVRLQHRGTPSRAENAAEKVVDRVLKSTFDDFEGSFDAPEVDMVNDIIDVRDIPDTAHLVAAIQSGEFATFLQSKGVDVGSGYTFPRNVLNKFRRCIYGAKYFNNFGGLVKPSSRRNFYIHHAMDKQTNRILIRGIQMSPEQTAMFTEENLAVSDMIHSYWIPGMVIARDPATDHYDLKPIPEGRDVHGTWISVRKTLTDVGVTNMYDTENDAEVYMSYSKAGALQLEVDALNFETGEVDSRHSYAIGQSSQGGGYTPIVPRNTSGLLIADTYMPGESTRKFKSGFAAAFGYPAVLALQGRADEIPTWPKDTIYAIKAPPSDDFDDTRSSYLTSLVSSVKNVARIPTSTAITGDEGTTNGYNFANVFFGCVYLYGYEVAAQIKIHMSQLYIALAEKRGWTHDLA